MSKFPNNDEKFAAVKALHLPAGEYAISSSGPLGARGIRAIGDIDIVVSDRLWDELAASHQPTSEGGVLKIVMSPLIDVFSEKSFPDREPGAPTVEQQIESADVIDGLPFVNLRHILHFKETMGRGKDAADIQSIRTILNS